MIPKNPKPTPREGLMVAIPSSEYNSLGGRFTYFLFQPLLREMIPFDSYDTHMFQMGWFNHHLEFG